MCDYSLEVYGSRPAREGEVLVTSRFPSGTIGLTAEAMPGTAVCLACDTALRISQMPAAFRKQHGLKADELGVFMRLDSGSYRDGIRFGNGAEICLQQFPTGISVDVAQLLENMNLGSFATNPDAYEGA